MKFSRFCGIIETETMQKFTNPSHFRGRIFLFFRRWQRTFSGVPRLCFAQDFEAAIPRPHTRQDTVRASGPDAIQCSRAEPPGSRRPRSGLRFCSAKGFGVIIPQPPKPKGSEDGAAAAVLPQAKPGTIQCSQRLLLCKKSLRLLYHLPAEKANLRWQDSHILYGLFPTV